MKAVQIVKPEDLRVIDIEKPVIDEKNNVLVKMTAAGILRFVTWVSTMVQMLQQPIHVSSDTRW